MKDFIILKFYYLLVVYKCKYLSLKKHLNLLLTKKKYLELNLRNRNLKSPKTKNKRYQVK